MSSAEVMGRGPYWDRTRLISCSATVGISNCDRTLSEAVTERTDEAVLRQGNVFSVTGRSGTGQPDAQSTTSDRVQRGSRAAPVRPDASDRIRPDSAQSPINTRALTVGTTRRVRSIRQQRPVSSTKLGFTPSGYFLHGAYKKTPKWPFEMWRAKETYQGC